MINEVNKMSAKQNYSYKTRKEDTKTTRMMIVFSLLIISVFALMSVKNWLDTTSALPHYEMYRKLIRYAPIIPLVASIASAFYFFRCKKQKKDESLKVLPSYFLLSVSLVALVSTLLISKYIFVGYAPSIILIVMVSLLYFISTAFPGSYTLVTVFNALGAFVIYALHLVSPSDNPLAHYGFRALAIVIAVLFVLTVVKARLGDAHRFGFKLPKSKAELFPLVFASVLFVVFTVLGMFGIGSYLVYDVIIALETIIFALFYAVRTLK